jgi:hypothetical protein
MRRPITIAIAVAITSHGRCSTPSRPIQTFRSRGLNRSTDGSSRPCEHEAAALKVITAKDLTDEDRNRLNGGVGQIIQKSDRDDASTRLRDRQNASADWEGRMKILYVEDNDDNVYMLKNRLSRAGFTVAVAPPKLVRGDKHRTSSLA